MFIAYTQVTVYVCLHLMLFLADALAIERNLIFGHADCGTQDIYRVHVKAGADHQLA